MPEDNEIPVILSAEYVGQANAPGCVLDIGGIKLQVWGESIDVHVRRHSRDLSIIEIEMVRHDGLATEELNRQNLEAEDHPLGPKDYWHTEMVGKYKLGSTGEPMTEEDFEEFWAEGEEDDE